jgi:hypothetical protein
MEHWRLKNTLCMSACAEEEAELTGGGSYIQAGVFAAAVAIGQNEGVSAPSAKEAPWIPRKGRRKSAPNICLGRPA